MSGFSSHRSGLVKPFVVLGEGTAKFPVPLNPSKARLTSFTSDLAQVLAQRGHTMMGLLLNLMPHLSSIIPVTECSVYLNLVAMHVLVNSPLSSKALLLCNFENLTKSPAESKYMLCTFYRLTWLLIPVTVALFGNRIFADRTNQLKRKSFCIRINSHSMLGVFRREKYGHKDAKEDCHVMTEAEIRVDKVTNQGTAKIKGHHQKLVRDKEGFHPESQREPSP
jgi:hypothetical protein